MKKFIRNETDPQHLREMLAKCETEIEDLAYDYSQGEKCYCVSNNDKIRDKMEIRADILDRLFELHFNEEDYNRLLKTNNTLETIERNMMVKHIDMFNKLQAIDKNYIIRTTLEYWHDDDNPQLIRLDDDAYYASKWTTMLDVLGSINLMANELFECTGKSDCPYNYGWRGSIKASFSMTSDIKPCYSFWELLTCKLYSIPDVFQITTFKYRHEALLINDITTNLND